MKARKDWWKTHFGRGSLDGYGLPARTRAEVRGAAKMLGLRGPSEVLDVACGAGRHALGLAALGHRVTGIDWSRPLLTQAARAAKAAGAPASFVRGDMRRLRYRARFDAAVNLFTSFGYFDTEAEDLAVLRGVRRALRPGGVFLMDVLNKDWLLRHFSPTFWQKKPDGGVVKAFNRLSFDKKTSRLSNRRTLYLEGGAQRETFLRFKVYARRDLERLLRLAGLRPLRAFGGFDARPAGPDAFRLIVAATPANKPAKPAARRPGTRASTKTAARP